jgi:hypothetical protein
LDECEYAQDKHTILSVRREQFDEGEKDDAATTEEDLSSSRTVVDAVAHPGSRR